MSLSNFSTENGVVTVNGRLLTDWGDTDPPLSEDPIDPKSVLRRGLGGNAVRLDRINPGKQVTLNLNPGSPDSIFMKALYNSNANITYARSQIGALETAVGSEGVIVNIGPRGRLGQTITDDQYIIEFNLFSEV